MEEVLRRAGVCRERIQGLDSFLPSPYLILFQRSFCVRTVGVRERKERVGC